MRTSNPLFKASLILIFAVFIGLVSFSDIYAKLPTIEFLGEGENTYTIEDDKEFIVKRTDPWRFDIEPASEFTGETSQQRVWSTDNGEYLFIYKEWQDFGEVVEGCTVHYVQIDDNVDERINQWYLDNELIHTTDQGMVVYGDFTVPRDGYLELFAEDSIAARIDVTCPEPTPNSTPTPTPTTPPNPTPTSTPTPTNEPTPTPTGKVLAAVDVLPETGSGYAILGLVSGLVTAGGAALAEFLNRKPLQ